MNIKITNYFYTYNQELHWFVDYDSALEALELEYVVDGRYVPENLMNEICYIVNEINVGG